MIERTEDQEQSTPSEPTGLPADLFDDPAKYDGDIPLWKRTVNFVRQYGNTRTEKRPVLLGQTAVSLVRNQATLGNFLDNLSLISQLKPEINVAEIEDLLTQRIEREAGNPADLARWTPDKIEELIRLGLDSSGRTKEVVEKMKVVLFNSPKNPEEATDLYYNAAYAMVGTNHNDLREEIFSILCFEKDWLQAGSPATLHLAIASMLSDDEHIQKNGAINEAIKTVGIFIEASGTDLPGLSVRSELRHLRMQNAMENLASLPLPQVLLMQRTMKERIMRDPVRYEKLQEYARNQPNEQENMFYAASVDNLVEETEKRKVELSRRRDLSWPGSVFRDPDEPIFVLIQNSFYPRLFKATWEEYKFYISNSGYESLTARPVQITDDLEIDIIARGYESQEQRAELVRGVLSSIISGKQNAQGITPEFPIEGAIEAARTMSSLILNYDTGKNIKFHLSRITSNEDAGKLSSVIEFHRPILSLENVRVIDEQNSGLRDEIRHKFTRSVGKRGCQLIIADPSLKTLGYESVSFRQEGSNTNVSLIIDGQIFEFLLDSDYRIRPERDIKRFLSPQDQAWLELLTLSHLKKLMCTEEDSLSDEMVGGKKQHEYYRKQKIGRIEHLRRLPPGQNFSTDAYIKCLKSDLPVKQLDRINKMRAERGMGGTKETGVWTYISGVERDIDTGQAKPVKIAFANATVDMRRVIPLGEISQEERERIEREILSELEI